jgi:hypothetical protein
MPIVAVSEANFGQKDCKFFSFFLPSSKVILSMAFSTPVSRTSGSR